MIYYDQGEQEVARVRKGTGTEDVSGDYVNYPEIKTENDPKDWCICPGMRFL